MIWQRPSISRLTGGSLIIYNHLFQLLKVVIFDSPTSQKPSTLRTKLPPGVEFHAVKGVAESLPFPAAQFDAVVGSLVMCGWAKLSE